MKRPNSTGGVRKLSGNRRKPYQAVVSGDHYLKDGEIRVRQVSLGTFATKKEALAALGQWQVYHLKTDMLNLTVEDVYNRIKDDWTPSVQKSMKLAFNWYESLLKMRLYNVHSSTIESVPLPPLSKSSHNIIRQFWHKIFMFGIENDIVMKDYSEFLKFNETKASVNKEVFSPDEIKVLAKNKTYKILLYTGMRINELLSMRSDQVYEENGILCFHIEHAKTKSGVRIIPVHSAIINDLDLSGEYVIGICYETIRAQIDRDCKNNGFSYHTLHDFRRTFASYAKSAGVDEYYRKCLMGHAHDNITDSVYTEPFIKDLKNEIEKIKIV